MSTSFIPPEKWRKEAQRGVQPSTSDEKALPQGLLVGKDKTGALIDTGDVHALMIGAARSEERR